MNSTSYIIILGIAQDGGYPQAGCDKECCEDAWKDLSLRRHVSCIAIVDPASEERWMIDATPDFKEQLRMLDEISPRKDKLLNGILLTHGHTGHYTGLINLGLEVMGTREIPVYVMPRIGEFLSNNGPWERLVKLNNISLKNINDGVSFQLNSRIKVTPFLVPHRDEYTETVGYRIHGLNRTAVFIPDIDKWEKWDKNIEDVIRGVDAAFIDGTFYEDGEISGRNLSKISHPFIIETMKRLSSLPVSEKNKIHFIHLNHTNPALKKNSEAVKNIERNDFHIAQEFQKFEL